MKWFTDNRAAAKISEAGRGTISNVLLCVFSRFALRIRSHIQWVPRNEVAKADFISRFIDVDNWHISHSLFLQLERLWGPHTVDCFENHYNFKISRFFSRF